VPGLKTNERPGTRAVLRHCRMSATKARQVLDLIRGQDVDRAAEILRTTEREAATVVAKVLASAVANAVHNDGLDAEDLYVSACFADEGVTAKRWRPRARGRATRIRKRTCHITVIVGVLPEERLARHRERQAQVGAQRSRRVAESRRRADLSGRLTRRRDRQAAAAAAAEAAAEEAATAEAEDASAEEAEADEVVEDAAVEAGTGADDGAPDEETEGDEAADEDDGSADEEKGE
jgi:large subunit ribosomal protein L22